METNNIFTESYDDPIMDESSANEIDILSTDDGATMDYDEIADYAAVSDDNRTVTLERFCEEFRQKLVNALDTSSTGPDLYFINEAGTEIDIRHIDNLLYFAIWDDEYITTNNIPYDVKYNRLMSFRVIKQCLKFKINLFEYFPSQFYGYTDRWQTQADVQPNIIEDSTNINNYKIISIQDFADFVELSEYFALINCDSDYCYDVWECVPEDPDCSPHESY